MAFSAVGASLWVRLDMYIGNASGANSQTPFAIYNGSTPVFRIATTSTTAWQAQYWNGSAWVNSDTSFTVAAGAPATWVVRIDFNSGFELFLGNVSIKSGSGWTGGATAATRVRISSNSSAGVWVSQIMAADYDIRDANFLVPAINGNSAANTGQLSGSYTDVNEVPTNDANGILISTVGNAAGQTFAGITVPVGKGIAAMVINGRGRVAGGTVTDGKLGARVGGTNYPSAGLGYGGGYEPRGVILENNPATSGAWNQTTFNAAEIFEQAA